MKTTAQLVLAAMALLSLAASADWKSFIHGDPPPHVKSAPRLSERYAVDGIPDGAKASDFMVQALEKMRGPVRIVIVSVANSGDARIAKAEFHYNLVRG
jgi:hypothetical protein